MARRLIVPDSTAPHQAHDGLDDGIGSHAALQQQGRLNTWMSRRLKQAAVIVAFRQVVQMVAVLHGSFQIINLGRPSIPLQRSHGVGRTSCSGNTLSS